MKFSFGKSSLRRALERGLGNGKLDDELQELGELEPKSKRDADDICWGLEQLRADSPKLVEDTDTLARFFQSVGPRCAAAAVLRERGIPELLRLFDEIQNTGGREKDDTLLFLLKIFAIYGTTAGTLKIIEAAQQPIKPDGFLWSIILGIFKAGHPQNELLFGSLSNPLPEGFIGVGLLDAANQMIIAGKPMPHPFDSPEGKLRLRAWLTSKDEEEKSYAHSAAAALPFIGNPERDQLLGVAMEHQAQSVRLESLWAAAKLGVENGLNGLVEHCRNWKSADAAKQYLSELGHGDMIPPAAKEPDFAALSIFSQWCAHPNELGRPPDELEIVDHRELAWPPERKLKPFWLLKYRLQPANPLEDEQIGCGLVGSITVSFFSYQLEQRPPEDCYAIHCYWEMEGKKLIEETRIEGNSAEYEGLLNEWRGPSLTGASLTCLAEISPELGYPQRLVGLASANLNGEAGWLVLDGGRSEWFPISEMPAESQENIALRIHVGSQLLGLIGKRDRKNYLRAPKVDERLPEPAIIAYEKLLADANEAGDTKRKKYYGLSGLLRTHIEKYADALVACGSTSKIRPVIENLRLHWSNPFGYVLLGKVAWKTGQSDLAEELLLKLKNECGFYEEFDEMELLAELWWRNGRKDAAKELLLDCLRRLIQSSKERDSNGKRITEKHFQSRKSAFLRLFPEDAGILATNGIPAAILGSKISP